MSTTLLFADVDLGSVLRAHGEKPDRAAAALAPGEVAEDCPAPSRGISPVQRLSLPSRLILISRVVAFASPAIPGALASGDRWAVVRLSGPTPTRHAPTVAWGLIRCRRGGSDVLPAGSQSMFEVHLTASATS